MTGHQNGELWLDSIELIWRVQCGERNWFNHLNRVDYFGVDSIGPIKRRKRIKN